jgi:AcrR family transcriptional regulator
VNKIIPFIRQCGGLIVSKTKLDRRVQRTRQLLQEALFALILEKGYEVITVQDLIDHANVGRSTFYSHFLDKDDLFQSGFEVLRQQLEQRLIAQPVGEQSLWTISLVLFQHAQHYHRVYKASVGKQAGELMHTHLHQLLAPLMREPMQLQLVGKKAALVPPEVLAHHVVSSLLALLTWWLDHDLPYSAEQVNEMYRQLTQPAIDSILQGKRSPT